MNVIVANYRNDRAYEQELCKTAGIELLAYIGHEQSNYQDITLLVDEIQAGLSRDQVVEVLWAENVLARRYFYPGCHRMQPYVSEVLQNGLSLPVTEKIVQQALSLPSGTATGPQEIAQVCQVIRLALKNAPAVQTQVARWAVPFQS